MQRGDSHAFRSHSSSVAVQKHYDLLTGDGVAEENPNPERVWNVFFFFFSDSFQFKY